MAGFVIDLAVAEEYLRKTIVKENYEEFIKGVIAPDLVSDKSLTHYGPKSSLTHLDRFFEDKDLSNSFNRGYFLHLVTDYIFYNKIIDTFSKDIYHDYDVLNKYLIEKYSVKIPEIVEKYAHFIDDELILLNLEDVEKCIRVCSEMELDDIEKQVKDPKYHDKWLKLRGLKYLDD